MPDNKQAPSHLPPGIQMPSSASPLTFEPHPASSQQLPYDPNVWSHTNQTFGPPAGRSHVHLPLMPSPRESSIFPEPTAHRSRQRDNKPQANLESQLRGMIISNNTSSSDLKLVSPKNPPSLESNPPSGTKTQTSYKRPNQAQRRQQTQVARQGPSWAHNQAPPTTASSRPWPSQSQVPQPYHHTSIAQPHGLPYAKRSMERRNIAIIESNPRTTVQAQIDYLDRLACEEVAKVQISAAEYDEKQALRHRLETVCRSTVCSFESQNDPEFRPESVELKSFGSLSIGFATRDSDMDLVLVSPSSNPGLGSPESPIPRLVEKALMDLGYGVRLLTQTRVPIIKFCEKPGLDLSACLRMTRLYWEDEFDHLANPIAKEIDTQVTEYGEDQFVESGAAHMDPSLQSAEKTLDILECSAEDTVVEVTSVDDVTQKPHPASGISHLQDIKENLENPSSVAARSTSDQNNDQRRSIQTDKWFPVRTHEYSNYSNQELAGICLRNTRLKRKNGPEQLLMEHYIQSIDTQTYPHQASEVEKARREVEAIPDLVKAQSLPSREELDFPKSGVGTQCDINFSNDLALQNSLLLKCYSICDPRVRVVVLFVKAWTKIRKINSPYHGTLNSYGYVLMVLHYLMNVSSPPVVPNLQLCNKLIEEDELSASETSFKGYNIRFFRNQSKIEEMARTGQITQNRESVGSLLRGFFQYYGQPPIGGFRWKEDVLSLRTPGGVLTKAVKGWIGARTETVDLAGPGPRTKKVNHHYVLAIEDPFEIEHNVARTVFFNGIVAIRDEFRRALTLITCAGSGPLGAQHHFFAEGAKNENLQRGSNRPGTGRGSGAQKPREKAKPVKNSDIPVGKESSDMKGTRGSNRQR